MEAAISAEERSRGCVLAFLRKCPSALAERMQLEGVDLDKNAIQRIECGKRFVTDIELRALAAIFKVPAEELLSEE